MISFTMQNGNEKYKKLTKILIYLNKIIHFIQDYFPSWPHQETGSKFRKFKGKTLFYERNFKEQHKYHGKNIFPSNEVTF
jgi:hypothetical protein